MDRNLAMPSADEIVAKLQDYQNTMQEEGEMDFDVTLFVSEDDWDLKVGPSDMTSPDAISNATIDVDFSVDELEEIAKDLLYDLEEYASILGSDDRRGEDRYSRDDYDVDNEYYEEGCKKKKKPGDRELKESTPNFNYVNRCVAVTGEDLEDGHHPEVTRLPDNLPQLRSYPRMLISDDFNYGLYVVMTSGYYEGACIDWIADDDNDPDGFDYSRYPHDFANDLSNAGFDDLATEAFDIVEAHENSNNIDDYSEEDLANLGIIKSSAIEEYNAEIAKVNAYIDEIKRDYGYKEYAVTGVASNGEAFYHEIGESTSRGCGILEEDVDEETTEETTDDTTEETTDVGDLKADKVIKTNILLTEILPAIISVKDLENFELDGITFTSVEGTQVIDGVEILDAVLAEIPNGILGTIALNAEEAKFNGIPVTELNAVLTEAQSKFASSDDAAVQEAIQDDAEFLDMLKVIVMEKDITANIQDFVNEVSSESEDDVTTETEPEEEAESGETEEEEIVEEARGSENSGPLRPHIFIREIGSTDGVRDILVNIAKKFDEHMPGYLMSMTPKGSVLVTFGNMWSHKAREAAFNKMKEVWGDSVETRGISECVVKNTEGKYYNFKTKRFGRLSKNSVVMENKLPYSLPGMCVRRDIGDTVEYFESELSDSPLAHVESARQ